MNKYISPILEKIRTTDFTNVLSSAQHYAVNYMNHVDDMPVYPRKQDIEKLTIFDESLPNEPSSNASILDTLASYGSKATVAQTGRRYFGFVCGGIMPSALCTKWLTDTWDQNPGMYVLSPISSKLEEVCEHWLVDLLGLPIGTAAGFVSGSSIAILSALATARNHLLAKLGWDVSADGLFGAPAIRVVLSEEAHSTVFKMLSVLGIGLNCISKVPTDEQGRMCMDKLPEITSSTLLILQAGNVNSGAFDNFETACRKAKNAGAWVHIDGAFGLWAAANPYMEHLSNGISLADSWNFDGHKTLNTPYDCGIVMCKNRQALVHAMHMTGAYIQLSEQRDNMMYTPEMSRRARATDLWATLKGLGKNGVAQLVEELHQKACYFAESLRKNDFEIVNDVVFNQVLVHFKDDIKTNALISALQNSGVLWLGGSKWKGKTVIRISVSSYKTTYQDIDMCVKEFIKLAT